VTKVRRVGTLFDQGGPVCLDRRQSMTTFVPDRQEKSAQSVFLVTIQKFDLAA